ETLGVHGPENRKGRYIHFGIREHGMAAAMNGMALHGGIRPYGGTFMCFADYMRGAMRLSALMGIPVTYVLTHDSIGLGEDGPTHQPVEHLAMLRATPNTLVIRPADAMETAEAWDVALQQTSTPSVLALSRQGLPAVRKESSSKNLVAQGAYILAESEGPRQAILIASGSEVALAMEAREKLQAEGIGTRVVSMPCWELFAQQEDSYKRRVLPSGPVRVGIEAGISQGWDRWLLGERGKREKAAFVGMSGFGASAPAERLFEEFGITADATVAKVKAMLDGQWDPSFLV
ncbi:MAG: transketolase-like TK C-terminal-containing protein, partial [Mangrovicoccus sp.]